MEFGEHFFTEVDVKHWNRLPRVVIESPSLETFKRPVGHGLVVYLAELG